MLCFIFLQSKWILSLTLKMTLDKKLWESELYVDASSEAALFVYCNECPLHL